MTINNNIELLSAHIGAAFGDLQQEVIGAFGDLQQEVIGAVGLVPVINAAVADAEAAAVAAGAAVEAYTAESATALLASTRAYPVGTVISTRAEGFAYEVVASGGEHVTAGGVQLRYKPSAQGFDARAFGASSANTDNSPAIKACYDAVVAAGGGVILLPSGTLACGGEIDVYRPNSPRIDVIFKGAGTLQTILRTTWHNAGQALFKGVDPAGVVRCSPTSFQDMSFATHSRTGGVCPVFIDIAGFGNSQMHDVQFGSSNNTHVRLGSIQNLRGSNIVSYYGGYGFPSKSTTGVTFSLSGQILTSSAEFFRASHVGDHISLNHSGAWRRYRIVNHTSATQVTVTAIGYRLSDVVGTAGYMDCPHVTITAGTNLVYGAPGDLIFTAQDVGRTILIQKARNGRTHSADASILRARIIAYVNTHAVRIGDDWGNAINADKTATDTLCGCPAFDLYVPRAPGGNISLGSHQSDLQISQFWVEHYRGVGLFAEDTDGWDISGKLHGETIPTSTTYSLAAAWLADVGGRFSGILDALCSSSAAQVYICDQNKVWRIENTWSRNSINERIVQAEAWTSIGGYVLVDGIDAQNYADSLSDLIIDSNTSPRAILIGSINTLGDTTPLAYGLGNGSYAHHNKLEVGPGIVQLGKSVDNSLVPNGGFAISPAGNLVFRDFSGTLRTVVVS